MMLHCGRTHPGKKTWGPWHERWLQAQHFDRPAQQLALREMILGVKHAMERLNSIDAAIIEFLPG
jgi:transposase